MKTSRLALLVLALAFAAHARAAAMDFARSFEFVYAALEKRGAQSPESRDGLFLGSDGSDCQIGLYATTLGGDIEDFGFKIQVTIRGNKYTMTFDPLTVERVSFRGDTLSVRIKDSVFFNSLARQPDFRSSDPFLGVPDYPSTESDVEVRTDRERGFMGLKAKNAAASLACAY